MNRSSDPHSLVVLALMVVIALFGTTPCMAVGFKLRTTVDQVELGEPFDVILESEDPAFKRTQIDKVEFVADPDKWNVTYGWEMLGDEKKIHEKQTGAWLWRAQVQGLDVGEFALPEAHVYVSVGRTKDEIIATTASMRVVGVRDPADQSMELAGPRPVRAVGNGWGWVWMSAIGVLGLGLLAWFLTTRMRAQKAMKPVAPPEPALPPGPWALREIDRRRELPECKPGHAKEIDSHASEVLRIYLGRRFGFGAIDMTTYECIRSMEERTVDSLLVERVRRFLNECDLVKFSKFEPEPGRWDGIWDDAKGVIESSTPAQEISDAERMLSEWRELVEAME